VTDTDDTTDDRVRNDMTQTDAQNLARELDLSHPLGGSTFWVALSFPFGSWGGEETGWTVRPVHLNV
jgi:hypothetical protein